MQYSRLIAGTMSWGSWGKQLSKNEMVALINHCLEQNIHTFDHADIYGGYTTESEFGKAILESDIRREDIQLITKCGIQYLSENRNNTVKHYDYSKEYILWSVENSLKNLRTDYVDLLLLHRPSPLMHPEEIAETVQTLKNEGKIKAFGVSNFTPSQMELIGKYTDVSVNQIEFSLTQHSAMQDGTLDAMMVNDIVPMCWSPLGSIFKDITEQTQRIHHLFEKFKKKYSATADQLALAWIMKHPSQIHPVIGTTDFERIKNASKASEIELETEDWFAMLVASQGHKVP